jgi:hypothetical protein
VGLFSVQRYTERTEMIRDGSDEYGAKGQGDLWGGGRWELGGAGRQEARGSQVRVREVKQVCRSAKCEVQSYDA